MARYKLKLIGGHCITEKKSLFSWDGKFVLAVSANAIRIYVISSGLPYGLLTVNNGKSKVGEEIASICLNPEAPDNSVISFSTTGRIVIWDYIKVEAIREYNLFDTIHSSCGNTIELLWGQSILYENDAVSGNLSFFYALSVDQVPSLYFTCIDEIERFLNKINSRKKKESKESTKEISDGLIEIKFDPQYALVGITIGACNKFLATICGSFINIVSLPFNRNSRSICHKIARNSFTCIASHHKEMLLAAGDSIGRIYIYRGNFCYDNTNPIRSVYHWHHSPVNDLSFSHSGAYLYSAGYESVIVRADVSMSHGNNFLPRIGAPIRYIAVDTMNEKIMTVHFDNSIYFANSNLDRIISSLDGVYLLPKQDFLNYKDFCYDPKSSAIVMRGKCGHLQFFSPSMEKHLFQLDIVNMNYLAPESDKVIINVDIDRFTISDDGLWLATVELRDDAITLPEMRLKFWHYEDSSESKYSLNTCIHLPHKKRINCLKFSCDGQHMVTTSQDGTFKIWSQTTDPLRQESKPFWISQRIGFLARSVIPERIGISEDFSIIAITSFNRTTLWDCSDVNRIDMKGTILPDEKYQDKPILSIELGTCNKAHLLSETRENLLRIWDLLTLSCNETWQPPNNLRIKFSVFHRQSNRLALFLSNGTLYLNSLDENSIKIDLLPPYQDNNLKLMVSGLFIPQNNVGDEIFSTNGLCLIDENQQIYSLGLVQSDDLRLENGFEQEDEEKLLTPYAKMLLEEKNKIKLEERLNEIELNQYLGQHRSRRKMIEQMFTNVPSHILPPIESITTSFLTLLLQPDSDKEGNTDENLVNENDNEINKILSDEDDGESEDIQKSNIKQVEAMEVDVHSKPNELFLNENYDWLASLL